MARPRTGSAFYSNTKKKWRVDYWINDFVKMQEKKVSKFFNTEKEARDFLEIKNNQRLSESFLTEKGITLKELMIRINERIYELKQISEQSYRRRSRYIKTISKWEGSNKRIEDITTEELQMYLYKVRFYSQGELDHLYYELKRTFEYAVNYKYILQNPMYLVKKVTSEKSNITHRSLTLSEQEILTNYLLNVSTNIERYRVAYLLQLYCGLRIGEACAIQIKDVDLENNTIRIWKTLSMKDGKTYYIKETTKTPAGIRIIKYNDILIDLIKEQVELAKRNENKLLFVRADGKVVSGTDADIRFKKICKKLKLKNISTHTLRHTFCTRCIEAGMDLPTLKQQLGHKHLSTTIELYSEIQNNYLNFETDLVNKYYVDSGIVKRDKFYSDTILENKIKKYTEEDIRYEIKKFNDNILFDNKNKILLLKNKDDEKNNKAIAIVGKNAKDLNWNRYKNKICFENWNEIKAFLDGIYYAKMKNL